MLLLLLLAASPLEVVKAGSALAVKADASVEQLATRADDFIDFTELARRALGPKWEELKPKQRDEFAKTLKEVLRASYASKLPGLGAEASGVEWGAEKVTGDEATVASTARVAGEVIKIEYRLLRKAGGEWRVYDVVTDGISLVEAYADQFRSVMAKKGYEGLLAALKKKKQQVAAAP